MDKGVRRTLYTVRHIVYSVRCTAYSVCIVYSGHVVPREFWWNSVSIVKWVSQTANKPHRLPINYRPWTIYTKCVNTHTHTRTVYVYVVHVHTHNAHTGEMIMRQSHTDARAPAPRVHIYVRTDVHRRINLLPLFNHRPVIPLTW